MEREDNEYHVQRAFTGREILSSKAFRFETEYQDLMKALVVGLIMRSFVFDPERRYVFKVSLYDLPKEETDDGQRAKPDPTGAGDGGVVARDDPWAVLPSG